MGLHSSTFGYLNPTEQQKTKMLMVREAAADYANDKREFGYCRGCRFWRLTRNVWRQLMLCEKCEAELRARLKALEEEA